MAASDKDFERDFKTGEIGEFMLRNYFIEQGIPIENKSCGFKRGGRGPKVFFRDEVLSSPDFHAYPFDGEDYLCEAKYRKKSMSWYRRKKQWRFGCKRQHYLDYVRIKELHNKDIYVFWFHEARPARYTPPELRDSAMCGMYYAEIDQLRAANPQFFTNDKGETSAFWASCVLTKVMTAQQMQRLKYGPEQTKAEEGHPVGSIDSDRQGAGRSEEEGEREDSNPDDTSGQAQRDGEYSCQVE